MPQRDGGPVKTRIVTAFAGGDADAAAATLAEHLTQQLDGQEAAFALVFASTAQPLSVLMPALKARLPRTRLIGSSTAGEFTEAGEQKGSVVVVAVAGNYELHAALSRGISADAVGAVERAAAALPASRPGKPHRTGILLLDPLAGRSEEVTLTAAVVLGPDVSLVGGAAGDDLHMQRTEVALDGEVASDALVLAVVYSDVPLGIGVHHGHQPVSRGLEVTRAVGNVVYEIEGRPAWQVWCEHTREIAASAGMDVATLPADQVGAFLLRFEAGLATGTAFKIRAPLSRGEDDSLSFACGIPEGAVIRITEGVPVGQIDSARAAARQARVQLAAPCAGAVVFDCICRNLILGSRFYEAVSAISSELDGAPLAGFETYGEIALVAGDMSGFHNTTTVVLAFPR